MCVTDADWASNKDDRRSISGFCIKYGNSPILWKSIKQSCVALSTMEAEFISIAQCSREAIWIQMLLRELFPNNGEQKILIKSDNQAAISFVKSSIVSSRSKHIDIRNHFVRDLLAEGRLEVQYIPTEENEADILTKPLVKEKTFIFSKRLGVITQGGIC